MANVDFYRKNHYGCNSYSGADMVAVMTIPNLDNGKGIYTLGTLQTISVSTNMQRTPIRSIGNINAKDYVMGPRTIAGSLVFAVFDRHFAYEAMDAIRQSNNNGDYHFLADELPPFDITIVFANEYGSRSKLVIYGIRLVNEGQVMSVNDIYIENTYQYVARDYDYMENIDDNPEQKVGDVLDGSDNIYTTTPEFINNIYDYKKDEEKDDLKNVIVRVKTTNALNNEKEYVQGTATFTLNTFKEDGYLEIYNTRNMLIYSIDIASTGLPVTQQLINGDYYVHYLDKNKEYFSQATLFSIKLTETDNVDPLKPLILFQEKTSTSYIIGFKKSDNITKQLGYAKKIDGKIAENWTYKTYDENNELVLLDLKLNTTYVFCNFNNNKMSKEVEIVTNGENEFLFSDYQNYIESNKNLISDEYYLLFNSLWQKAHLAAAENNNYSISDALYTALKSEEE